MLHLVTMSTVLWVLASPPGVPAHSRAHGPYTVQPSPPLPADAQRIVDDFRARERQILARAEAQIAPERAAAAKRLESLLDQLTRQARLDDALAVRDALREVSGVRPDPGYLSLTQEQIGRTYRYEVVGASSGAAWGTDVYTSDSYLGTVAVHAGLLQEGQTGVIVVRVLPGRQSYRGSTRNGITSSDYGPWHVSFSVTRGEL